MCASCPRESELILRVQGPRPENIIFLVHEVFEGLISESFRGVTYDYQIPCPDCLKIVCDFKRKESFSGKMGSNTFVSCSEKIGLNACA
ncbi:hypothetical protein DPMN_141308 [Dreissena polymorpha]|uniref:C-terminal of Roc COR-B domain-containing protein n=1 Tax=Dreissena polymorpha TaxID=45954 RepID=A0A9D4GD65_DREPO|nr:hypothetical protein DPMN_141308 [Dreissena polymorpha]